MEGQNNESDLEKGHIYNFTDCNDSAKKVHNEEKNLYMFCLAVLVGWLNRLSRVDNKNVEISGHWQLNIRDGGGMIAILLKKGKGIMADNILKVKNEMKKVIKSNGITRLEKDKLLRKRKHSLSKKERKILLNECRRDYETWNRFRDIKELITAFLSGIGLLIALFEILNKDSIERCIDFQSIVVMTTIYICISVFVLTFAQVFSSARLDISQQMIDILEHK